MMGVGVVVRSAESRAVVSYKLKCGPFSRAVAAAIESWLSTVSENCLDMRRGFLVGALLVE